MAELTDLFRYDGKRALVVGCYSGMGASAAKIVQLLGGEVHGVDYKEPDDELASFTTCDLRNKVEIDSMLESVQGPFDAVFYCAGLPPTHPALDVMTVNLAATRAVVEGIQPKVARGGAIAIISSTGGMNFMAHMEPIKELLATDGFDAAVTWCKEHEDIVAEGYVFSKEAIIVYTMQRAVEVVDAGVRVNCISPGPTQTPMMGDFESQSGAAMIKAFSGPMNRYATPDEMGWPLAFLNSPAASFVNGFNLIVDGGFMGGMISGAIDLASLIPEA